MLVKLAEGKEGEMLKEQTKLRLYFRLIPLQVILLRFRNKYSKQRQAYNYWLLNNDKCRTIKRSSNNIPNFISIG